MDVDVFVVFSFADYCFRSEIGLIRGKPHSPELMLKLSDRNNIGVLGMRNFGGRDFTLLLPIGE